MSTLLMLKGLPASGKSTHGFELVKSGWKRVNKDDLRQMIDGGKWTRGNEKEILRTEKSIVSYFLSNGLNVVVDDTNFAHEDTWKQIAESCGATFEVKFFDTPLLECIERDSKRGDKSVGSKVIMEMYERYLKPTPVPYDTSKPDCYLFDIDGTLAHMHNRSPYDWDKVYDDTLDESVYQVLLSHKNAGKDIIILSGRDGICRGNTIAWLKKHNIPYDMLYMREKGDSRKDTVIKKEIYDTHIKDQWNVLGIYDDRDCVVNMWRSLGLKCYQCDYGNF